MRVTILQGHPDPASFNASLAKSYHKGLQEAGHECRYLDVSTMNFDPILARGYHQIQPLEKDLVLAQEAISWCQHFVLNYPIWWGQMPAGLKGFFDRCFLPGWAFKYHKDDPFWDRLLAGRSARLIVTSDAPILYNFFAYSNGPIVIPKKMILGFCGFKPVRVTKIGSVKNLKAEKRQALLNKIEQLGRLAE